MNDVSVNGSVLSLYKCNNAVNILMLDKDSPKKPVFKIALWDQDAETVMNNSITKEDEIAGINAVANAILNEKGSIINVSTFPLNIPYCFKASPSVKKLCKPLFTVIESMFLFIEVNIAGN